MKNFFLIFIACILCMQKVMPQTALEKTYGTRYADEIVSSFVFSDSSSLFFMNKWHQSLSAIGIFKTNGKESIQWAKTTEFSNYRVNSAIQTFDGNIAFAGNVPRPNQYSSELKNALVAKVDTSGNMIWSRIFRLGFSAEATKIIQLPDSSLFITGYAIDQGEQEYKLLGIHIDKQGNTMNTFSYYQSPYNFANDIIFCHDSTIMIIGDDNSSQSKMLIANFKLNGEAQWGKVLSLGEFPLISAANAIATDNSNNYYITGNTLTSILCVKLNADFNIEWSASYLNSNSENSSPAGVDIQSMNDSVIIITGNTFSRKIWTAFPRPPSDIVLIAINPGGDTLWTSAIGSIGDDYAISGNKSDTVLNIDGSTYSLATEGDYDGYHIRYIPGETICNYRPLDCITDTIEFTESFSINMGSEMISVDTTITWMADTIGFHDACICHPPKAFFKWYGTDGTVTGTNYSSWESSWVWNIGQSQQSEEYHIDFVGENINLCLQVENECGSDEYCELVYGGASVSDINRISLQAYPVPSSDKIYLEFQKPEGNPDIRIFNAEGKQVKMIPAYTENSLAISKQETGSGLFVVIFMLDSKVIAMRKIIFE